MRRLRALLSGYDRRSWIALLLLGGSGLLVGARPTDLLGPGGRMDVLLAVMWLWLALVLPWRLRLRRDLVVLAFGAAGGALIESWGTWTGVWWYATAERPPWWVVPAWATTALAGERTAQILLELARSLRFVPEDHPRAFRAAYFVVLGSFALAMSWFSLHGASLAASSLACATMICVIALTRSPHQDLAAFVAGSLLGLFIEPWGTRSGVWTYYTLQTPPAVAVFAHGFATVAFLRATGLATLAANRLLSRRQPSSA